MKTGITQNSVILSCIQRIRTTNRTGLVVILCAVSCFFHYIVTSIVLFAGLIFLLFSKHLFRDTFLHKRMILFVPLSILLIVVPWIHHNFKGILAGVGIILIGMLFLLCCKRMTLSLFDTTLDACCIASYVTLLYAICEKIIFGWEFRSTAGICNANYYGTILEFTILICLYRMMRMRYQRLFYGVTLIMCSIGVFLCDSQSTWMAISVSVFLLFLLCKKKRAILWGLGGCAILIIIALAIPGIMERVLAFPHRYDVRSYIWHDAMYAFLKYPIFGFGTMGYSALANALDLYPATHAHNLYLDALLCYGIVGVSLCLFYVALYFKKVFIKIRTRYCYVCSLAVSAIVAILVHGLTDHTVLWIQTGFLFGIILCGAFVKRTYRGEK